MSEAGKIKKTVGWQYRIADIRDDVKLYFSGADAKGKLIVAEVTSGDSGKKYWVQLIFPKVGKVMSICECPEGYFKWPLAVYGLQTCCKHADNLIVFLREKKLI